MKNFFELIMPVLGLSICILAAQIPAVSWTAFIPFHYFVPQIPHPTNTIAVGPSLASESASPIIEKLEMTHLHRELSQIRVAIAQLTTKSDFRFTMNQAVEEILSNLQMITTTFATKLDFSNLETTVERIDSNLMKLTTNFEKETAVVDIGHMPESCTDLQSIGYKMNGVFQIKGKKQIENVYCNFTATNIEDLEKWIGYVDVKSAPTYFYVQKNNHFSSDVTFNLTDNVKHALTERFGVR